MALAKTSLAFICFYLLVQKQAVRGQALNNNEADARAFLNSFNEMAMEVYSAEAAASWDYNTNLTDENREKYVQASLVTAGFDQEARQNASTFDRTRFSADTVRQLEKLLYIGDSALEDDQDLMDLTNIITKMDSRYSKGKVCLKKKCYNFEPDLVRILAESRNYAELYWAWDGWRDEVGKPAREDYKEYVRLKNKAAIANDQSDAGAYWRSWYEVDDLKADVLKLYNELKPFYEQLHAYVRRKLYNVYGSKYINLEGGIPAHIFGNMWAQEWQNLLDICEPFPGKPSVDITPSLKAKGYDALRMFEEADSFFTSIGLSPMPPEFWNHSMIEKPNDGRDVVCHASAMDFLNQKDFRISMCTDVNQINFITIHHEMGHIAYFMQYKDQPVIYRDGANNGFHEAVGDALALSVLTPQHLHTVGLLDEIANDTQADINYLMSVALEKISLLPWIVLVDLWRWDVFNGTIPDTEYNQAWWKLRMEYQGIVPPTERSEMDFDPASKYHIAIDVPYVRYFIANILQFQFHEALCTAAGHTGPLHKCDIYQSTQAGTLLSNMLKLGSSVPWPVAMEKITGQRQMSAKSLVKYFEPLMEFLEKENAKSNETIGWPNTEWKPEAPPAWTNSSATTTMSLTMLLMCLFVFWNI
ncbi:angiotensin-converting enzyme-like [Amphiura filiformis]|uniref:angiotensin-converting enzyme-like n=1 Tax=Amphiura filiformis TaxID=82378 RepID=UPI003B210000